MGTGSIGETMALKLFGVPKRVVPPPLLLVRMLFALLFNGVLGDLLGQWGKLG